MEVPPSPPESPPGPISRTVCIVGGGPSGLVAAKTLLHAHFPGTFHVTVYEAKTRIGGLWPTSKDDDGMVNPEMCTNQSKHTVSFSDFAWEDSTPQFPKAWMVGHYLERYLKCYPVHDLRLGMEVLRVEPRGEGWDVVARGGLGLMTRERYDFVIIATGFFGKPRIPSSLEAWELGAWRPARFPVWHSSRFRNVEKFLTDDGRMKPSGTKIVVVGGQMSGVEVAASIALQFSSEVHTPGSNRIPDAGKYEVVHIVQQPSWVMPLYFPNNPQLPEDARSGSEKRFNPAPTFLPVDLVTYNLAARPPGPIANTSGHVSTEAAEFTHDFMNKYIGSDQSDLGIPALAIAGDVRSKVPFVTVSDEYTEFVRSGNIKIVKGKLIGRFGHELATLNSIIVRDGDTETIIHDVAGVLYATGFDATSSLSFLPQDILKNLQFDSTAEEFPLALNVNGVLGREEPTLGFVGFYRSPYWGVMEMQARFLGKYWEGSSKASKALAYDTTMETMLKLRKDPRRSQFPMGDYAYLMDSYSQILDITRFEPDNGDGRTGLVFPPRFTPNDAGDVEKLCTKTALERFYATFEASEKRMRFLARAAFRALQGTWRLEREIKSFADGWPSGKLVGTAWMLPRFPTTEGFNKKYPHEGFDKEYLYLERGEFLTTTGLKFTANRSYVYRYAEIDDSISVWFTKDDHKTVDYFFHEIKFLPRTEESEGKGWLAKAGHWCQPDQYDVDYEFRFKGAGLEQWSPRYEVKGPSKDYIIKSRYRRYAPGEEVL